MKTLRDAVVGDTVTVLRLYGRGAVRRRIMDMGVTRGALLTVRRTAPLGDPVEFYLRGTSLSLRLGDCGRIEVLLLGHRAVDSPHRFFCRCVARHPAKAPLFPWFRHTI